MKLRLIYSIITVGIWEKLKINEFCQEKNKYKKEKICECSIFITLFFSRWKILERLDLNFSMESFALIYVVPVTVERISKSYILDQLWRYFFVTLDSQNNKWNWISRIKSRHFKNLLSRYLKRLIATFCSLIC